MLGKPQLAAGQADPNERPRRENRMATTGEQNHQIASKKLLGFWKLPFSFLQNGGMRMVVNSSELSF